MDSGHLVTKALHEVIGLLTCYVAAHGGEHGAGDVLQCDVEVATYVLMTVHHLQELPREVCGIAVVQAYPAYSFDVGHAVDELGNGTTVVKVDAVIGEFLGYDVELLDALFNELPHLIEYFLHRTALVTAGDEGDGAVGAAAVAALRDLHIGVVRRGGEQAAGGEGVVPGVAEVSQQTRPVELAVPAVDFGDFGLQLFEVALRETSHDVETAEGTEGAGGRTASNRARRRGGWSRSI